VTPAGVKMPWVELDRILSEEIARDDDIRHRVAAIGRPLRSHATGISEDDLLASSVVSGWMRTARSWRGYVTERCPLKTSSASGSGWHDWDADSAWWICLTELWQRWWLEKACLEPSSIQVGTRVATQSYGNFGLVVTRADPVSQASATAAPAMPRPAAPPASSLLARRAVATRL
jgi:hypothetical protein